MRAERQGAGWFLGFVVLAALPGCGHAEKPVAVRGGGNEADFRVFDADGPPLEGPSAAELMRLPDAVPRRERPSWYGNPREYVVHGRSYRPMVTSRGFVERGIASWYGRKFHRRLTSTREPYDMFAMTAAHRTLPLPTYVRVTNLENGRSVVVRVNDRGPFHAGRIIDLSYAAAAKIGIAESGTARVEIRAIEPGPDAARVSGGPTGEEEAPSGYVQLGVFASRANAERAYATAAALRPDLALMTRVKSGDARLYRVRIGPLREWLEANRLLDSLAARGIPDARLLMEAGRERVADAKDE